uniref:Uncharacterized protein n=1 Tax=Oryza barthii TaxID=65489 RepID=A0A0D3GFQ1_9ORYZ
MMIDMLMPIFWIAKAGAEAGRAATARWVQRPVRHCGRPLASWPGDGEEEAVWRLCAIWRPGRRGGAGYGLGWRRRWRQLRPLARADPAAAAQARGSGGGGCSGARIRVFLTRILSRRRQRSLTSPRWRRALSLPLLPVPFPSLLSRRQLPRAGSGVGVGGPVAVPSPPPDPAARGEAVAGGGGCPVAG